MTHRNSIVSLFALIALLIVLLLLALACEPALTYWVENRTDQALIIYNNSIKIGEVAPGETAKMDPVPGMGRYWIDARNSEGELVYTRELSGSQLRDLGGKVVIFTSSE
jgi:hypothetical protein